MAEVAEGQKEQELDFSYAKEDAFIRTIRADVPCSEEQLADVPSVRALLENRLRRMAILHFDRQIINGDGTNLSGGATGEKELVGLLSTSGIKKQNTAAANKAGFTAIFKMQEIRRAMVKARNRGNTRATGILISAAEWAEMTIQYDNGNWSLGSPAALAAPRLWGLPVAEADVIPDTTAVVDASTDETVYAIVGDFLTAADLYVRQGATIQAGWIADDFAKHMIRLKIVFRAGLAVYQPAAFVEVESKLTA